MDGSYALDVLPVMLLLGVGFGLAMPALTGLAMSDARPEDAGVASGLFNTTQVMGGAFGLAVLSTLASGRTEDLLRAGESAAPALNGGYQHAFLAASVVAAAALALAAVLLRSSREAAADEAQAPASAAGAAAARPDEV